MVRKLKGIGPGRLSKKRGKGGFKLFLGYFLSPLSWWNDTFVVFT